MIWSHTLTRWWSRMYRVRSSCLVRGFSSVFFPEFEPWAERLSGTFMWYTQPKIIFQLSLDLEYVFHYVRYYYPKFLSLPQKWVPQECNWICLITINIMQSIIITCMLQIYCAFISDGSCFDGWIFRQPFFCSILRTHLFVYIHHFFANDVITWKHHRQCQQKQKMVDQIL